MINAYLFNTFFRLHSYRHQFMISWFWSIIGASLLLAASLRLNVDYGLSDLTVAILYIVFMNISTIFTALPLVNYYTKISPFFVEASFFAMLTGFGNLATNFISPLLGAHLCQSLTITTENLDNYWKLVLIFLICTAVSALYILIVPKNS